MPSTGHTPRRVARPLACVLACAFLACGPGATEPTPHEDTGGVAGDDGTEPATVPGLLFGPFHVPDSLMSRPFSGGFRALSPDSAVAVLEAARAADVGLVVTLAGGRSAYQEPSGAFSVTRFTELLDRYADVDFGPYIQDSTLVGLMMFDEPHDPGNWDGAVVPLADIEAAAAATKQRIPGVPVGVGAPPGFLAPGAPWTSLDFAFAPYSTKHGSVGSWLPAQVQAAGDAALALLVGINVLLGNQQQPVTADQLRTWGTALLGEASTCGLLLWKWDAGYFGSPDVAAAVDSLRVVADGRPRRPCRR